MRLLSIPQLGESSPSLSVGWMVLYSDNLRSRTPGFTQQCPSLTLISPQLLHPYYCWNNCLVCDTDCDMYNE